MDGDEIYRKIRGTECLTGCVTVDVKQMIIGINIKALKDTVVFPAFNLLLRLVG
jgi:hypothetical protein